MSGKFECVDTAVGYHKWHQRGARWVGKVRLVPSGRSAALGRVRPALPSLLAARLPGGCLTACGSVWGARGGRGAPLERLARHRPRPGSSEGPRPLPRGAAGTPFPSAPRAPAAEAGPGRWRRPCRPWLLRAACCGFRCGAQPACYRRGPPSCGEVSTAAGGGLPALRPALPCPARSRAKGGRATGCRAPRREGTAERPRDPVRPSPPPCGFPLRRRGGRAEGSGLAGAGRTAAAGTRPGPAAPACPVRVLVFPRLGRPGRPVCRASPGETPRPRAARRGAGAGSRPPAPWSGGGVSVNGPATSRVNGAAFPSENRAPVRCGWAASALVPATALGVLRAGSGTSFGTELTTESQKSEKGKTQVYGELGFVNLRLRLEAERSCFR